MVELAGEGTDHVNASVSYEMRRDSQHTETLTLIGTSDINGLGNCRGNTIIGNSGANVLEGFWGDDLMFGGDGQDTLVGGHGNDTFLSGPSSDTISSGALRDSFIGGIGDDIYIIDHRWIRIVEQANEGTDNVRSSISLALRDHSQHLELLSLTGATDIDGTGNGLANVITGNSGNNVLNGAWGDDTLIGGAGNDTFLDDNGADSMVGGLGDDTYRFDNLRDQIAEAAGEGTDHVDASVTVELRKHSQHLETLTLIGSDNISGTGNGLGNILTGNSGNNVLDGAWGDDTLIGGAGNDTLIGGVGIDTFSFYTGDGQDGITGFEDDIDVIDIQGAFTLVQVGADVRIDHGIGDSVLVSGMTVVDLTDDVF